MLGQLSNLLWLDINHYDPNLSLSCFVLAKLSKLPGFYIELAETLYLEELWEDVIEENDDFLVE